MDNQNLIAERMQRLLCLGLERQPAAELIPGTIQVWVERLGSIHPTRLSMAFDRVEEQATSWPTPATIMEALPIYESEWLPKPEPSPHAQRIETDPEYAERAQARAKAEIAKLAEMFKAP